MTLEEHLMQSIGAMVFEQARLKAELDAMRAKLPPTPPAPLQEQP